MINNQEDANRLKTPPHGDLSCYPFKEILRQDELDAVFLRTIRGYILVIADSVYSV